MMRRLSSQARLSLAIAATTLLGALGAVGAHAQGAFTSTVSSTAVPLVGVVSGGTETVSFSGRAQIKANGVTDLDFGKPPTVLLTIDMGNVSGLGALTGARYLSSDRAILTRRLATADAVQYTFPF